MNDDEDASSITYEISVGPFRVVLKNYSKEAAGSAIDEALDLIDSKIEKASNLAAKFGGIQLQQKAPAGVHPGHVLLSNLSIAEFVKKIGSKKGTDTTLAIAYYLFKARGVDVVNTKDLNDAFDEARMAKLKNPSDTFNTLIKSGKMKEAAEKDSLKGFTITQTGEAEIEELVSQFT